MGENKTIRRQIFINFQNSGKNVFQREKNKSYSKNDESECHQTRTTKLKAEDIIVVLFKFWRKIIFYLAKLLSKYEERRNIFSDTQRSRKFNCVSFFSGSCWKIDSTKIRKWIKKEEYRGYKKTREPSKETCRDFPGWWKGRFQDQTSA